MIGLRLLVETPRGGDAGHRFLTSRHDRGDSEVASVATEASQNAVGRSYISVSRQVTQRLPNGAVREGVERMILVGLDVDQLQSEQIEQVKSELNKLLPALDTLIASMDWPSGNRSTVILCEELRNWVAGEVFAHLPHSELTVAGSFHKSVTPLRSIEKWLLIATLVAACGGIILLSSGRQGGQTEGGKDPTPPTPPTNETRVETLAGKWDCSTEELVRSLKRANNWDYRREADVLSLKAGLADGEVLTMLKTVEASSGSGQFFVSPDIKDESGFRGFIEGRSSPSAVKMEDRRKWLYSAWLSFNRLKQAADNVKEAQVPVDTEDACWKMLISVAAIQEEVGFGDFFQAAAKAGQGNGHRPLDRAKIAISVRADIHQA